MINTTMKDETTDDNKGGLEVHWMGWYEHWQKTRKTLVLKGLDYVWENMTCLLDW